MMNDTHTNIKTNIHYTFTNLFLCILVCVIGCSHSRTHTPQKCKLAVSYSSTFFLPQFLESLKQYSCGWEKLNSVIIKNKRNIKAFISEHHSGPLTLESSEEVTLMLSCTHTAAGGRHVFRGGSDESRSWHCLLVDLFPLPSSVHWETQL